MLYAFLGAAYALIWLQLTLMHWRGGFHNAVMWGPVLVTPLLAVGAFVVASLRGEVIDAAFAVLFGVGTAIGLVGTAMHLRGDAAQIGGLTLRNMMSGPPPVLPLLYMALAVLGLAIHYWPSAGAAA
ncbi:MAG TPA: hypothetical protein VEL28_04205 [Candidatus Binatia bacterium]|nr:hypothetical protein [Candidatus Binatia bacterium]